MQIVLIIIIICLIIFICKTIQHFLQEQKKFKQEIENLTSKEQLVLSINEANKERNAELKKEESELLSKISIIKNQIDAEMASRKQNIENQEKLLIKTAADSYDSYRDTLEKSYNLAELKYKQDTELLKEEVQKVQQELTQIKKTRDAVIQANIREKEVEEKLSFYCPKISSIDLADIKTLNCIKPQLRNPRILSMLIWSTYYQKPMTEVCNNVLGVNCVCGIYKITNQLTKMCYVGQSLDVAKRWKDHAKCGLGIDTPAGNKLYKAMQQYGLENFSFELLEKCSSSQLNEKEKYYISLQDAYNYGYNSNNGNKK